MKMLKKLPRKVCLPEDGNVLPFVAAGLLFLWGIWGFVVSAVLKATGMISGNFVFVLAAVLLALSQRKEQSVGAYRLACLLMACGCVTEGNGAVLLVALALFVASLNLWGNVSLESDSKLLHRPVAALILLAVLAVLWVDQVVFIIRDFRLIYLGDLFGIAALAVLALSLESREKIKVKAPRMQAVPGDGSSLLVVGVLVLMVAITGGFINTVKNCCGVDVTDTIRAAFAAKNGVDLGRFWQPLLQYIISMAACFMMLGVNRKKNFLAAMTLLFFMNNPLRLEKLIGIDGAGMAVLEMLSGMAVLVVVTLLLISAAGLKWNKQVGKFSRMNLTALITAVILTFSLATSAVDNVGTAIENQKNKIVEAVKDASDNAVYDAAYNGELDANTTQAAVDASYAAVKEAVYDPAFKAAQEVGRKDVNITPEQLEGYTKTIADNISINAAEFSMQGMEYSIYEAMVEMLAEIPATEIAMQEVFGEVPAAREDFRAKTEQIMRKEFYDDFEYYSGRGTVQEMYLAACRAAAPLMFDAAFESAYNTVYDGIYDLLNNVAVETANETLAEYDGTVYLRAAGVVLRAIPGLLEMIGLILLTMSLTVQPVAQTKTWFRRLLDWCYTNVGEKLQKCMKLLGGIHLALGALGLLAIPVGVLLIPTAPPEVSLVLIAGGIAALIVVAFSIIMTYPLFAFAQQSADVHTICNRTSGAVLAAVPAEKAPAATGAPAATVAPAAPAASVTEAPFNPDELPDL